jgi:class 3 adenylate cyclase
MLLFLITRNHDGVATNFTQCAALRAVPPPGSEYKIDASYLSPNVNLASRLEAATKQYGCPLLLSRDFVDCLSPAVRAKVRPPPAL